MASRLETDGMVAKQAETEREDDDDVLLSKKYPPDSVTVETTVLRDGRLHVIVRRKKEIQPKR